jgi:chemotaxis protein MotB
MSDPQKGRSAEQQPAAVIIIKKYGGHAAHHGGAWKVAYADFVTSMMCLFIVLWIVNQSEDVKKAVAGYFRDPGAFYETTAGGLMSGESLMPEPGTALLPAERAEAQKALEDVAGELREQLADMEHFDQLASQIEIRMTDSGLNIQMVETANSLFFEVGCSKLSATAMEVLEVLARQLGKLPNKLSIEGHTDSRPYPAGVEFTNWELSSDRANSARRFMNENGVPRSQVAEVAGYADTRLRNPANPTDVSNRRISITVLYEKRRPRTPASTSAPEPVAEPLPHK